MFIMQSMINLKHRASRMQTKVYFQYAEATPMFIMQSMINLNPQTFFHTIPTTISRYPAKQSMGATTIRRVENISGQNACGVLSSPVMSAIPVMISPQAINRMRLLPR